MTPIHVNGLRKFVLRALFFSLICVAHAHDSKTLSAVSNYQMINRYDFEKEYSNNSYGLKSFVVLPDYDSNSIVQVMEHSIKDVSLRESTPGKVLVEIDLVPSSSNYVARKCVFETEQAKAAKLLEAFQKKTLSISCEFDLIDRQKVAGLKFNVVSSVAHEILLKK